MAISAYLSTATDDGSALRASASNNPSDVETSILNAFLSDIEHAPIHINATNKELEGFMRSEMETRGFACLQLERTLHLAASLIELAYNDRSFCEKKNIALFNWYLIYVDDMAPRDPSTFSAFEQRFLSGQRQLDPVLDALVEVLMRLWDLYDPLCANSIIAATFEFFTSTCIEPELETLSLIQGTQRFSWYMRERTGVATAFGLMMFTKSTGVHMMEFIQAIPDMNFWICLTNDLLSFHKEELAGETANYVHTRAYIDNKAPLEVLAEMAEELRISRNSIHKVLSSSPKALVAWIIWERGYVAWHLAQERYKLKDLGILLG